MKAPVAKKDLPSSIQKIVDRARSELNPSSIVLFGSRAREDGSETSDFDFAFTGVQNTEAWNRFCNFVHHDAATLYGVDLVRYEAASQELRARIDEEGRPIHECSAIP